MLSNEFGSRGIATALIATSVIVFLSQIVLGIVFHYKNK